MIDHAMIPVSPRHAVKLAPEYCHLIERPPGSDYVVRTLVHRKVGGMPLMSAELVIASLETRARYPLAATYPLHFRKTYFPASLHGDPQIEFNRQSRASELLSLPPPIGWSPLTFRSCFLPGKPYSQLSPFGVDPEENNVRLARELPLAAAAGLWLLMERAFAQFQTLHRAGIVHGDAELHNLIVCPAPLEMLLIDFENAVERTAEIDEAAWKKRTMADLALILRESIFLQCTLGLQSGALAECAWEQMEHLFKAPERFRREIRRQASV
ncbi:MAG: lipopolysaccharide kinase InaA family protein [Verrucomicrobiota bacterium]